MTGCIADLRRMLILGLLALGATASAAAAQTPLTPSVSPFTPFAPPTGIAEFDFNSGTSTDIATGVAVFNERIYTVGQTGGNPAMGIVARRPDGTFDTGFSGDGRMTVDIAAGTQRDLGSAIAVLPDGRLRVLGATDVDAGTQTSQLNLDVAIVGLNSDGSPDQDFGGGDGIVTFPVGSGNDIGTRMELDAAGRIAVTGCTITGTSSTSCEAGQQDFFVSLRNPDGSPAGFDGADGVRTFNRGGTAGNNVLMFDRGVDVAFRPGGGLIALLQVETNPDAVLNSWHSVLHAFKEDGSDDPAFSEDGDLDLPLNPPDVIPGGLMVHGERLWVTGQVRGGDNGEAYLVRMNADGSDLRSRTFDIRGDVIAGNIAVSTQGTDLIVVPGDIPTLLVGGYTTLQSTTSWSAAAFRDFEAEDLSAARIGDHIFAMPRNASNTEQQGQLLALAAGGADWAAGAGFVRDSSISDTSFGTVRALIDAEKRCDLAIEVPRPLEIEFIGGNTTTVDVKVNNVGSKACTGNVVATGAYRLGTAVGPDAGPAPLVTGLLVPGASKTFTGVPLTYTGARRRDDTVSFQLTAAGDATSANNVRILRAIFRFCDVTLARAGTLGVMPSEGTRSLRFTVRNVGTSTCRNIRIGVSGQGRALRASAFTLAGGVSATEILRVRFAGRLTSSARIAFDGTATEDVDPANGRASVVMPVVRVGDSDIRSVTRRGVSGTARRGRGGGLSRRQLRVARVQVAIRPLGRRCRWLTTRGSRSGSCSSPVWLRARGTSRWRLPRSLPRGRYLVLSRATIRAGYPEARFSAPDRNQRTVRIR